MRKKIEQIFCDICGEPARKNSFTIPVVFPASNQIRMTVMDICDDCIRKGFKIFGSYNADGTIVYKAGEEADPDDSGDTDDPSNETPSDNTDDTAGENGSGENSGNGSDNDNAGDNTTTGGNDAVNDGNTDDD